MSWSAALLAVFPCCLAFWNMLGAALLVIVGCSGVVGLDPGAYANGFRALSGCPGAGLVVVWAVLLAVVLRCGLLAVHSLALVVVSSNVVPASERLVMPTCSNVVPAREGRVLVLPVGTRSPMVALLGL